MKQSILFSKTRKESPKDEVSKNADLLIRAGYIHKEMAGVYTFLPLGLRVLSNINEIVRQEMNKIGGQEMFLSALQERTIWEKTGRWSDQSVDIWFKTKLKNDTVLGLGFTHEEPLTNLMRDHIRSWRDLPRYVYQIQTKFRNEIRAKSGIIRGREFLMKDLYSFCRDQKEHDAFYEIVKDAYMKIFTRAGIADKTYVTFASGGSFSKYSHEFQTLTSAGEDTIHLCLNCKIAINDEIIKENPACPRCGNRKLKREKSIEVGNIFSLGTRFSEAFGLVYVDEKGAKIPVIMGSYGIGPGRLMGVIAELLSDEKGLIWPEEVAPYEIHLIAINDKTGAVVGLGEKYEAELEEKNISVLFDDRDARAGEKFADADLIGIGRQVIVSEKNSAAGIVEIKSRMTGTAEKKKWETFVQEITHEK